MKLFMKGFIIGIGKILPGISGSMIAISLGIYNELIESISNLKKTLKENKKFLITTGLGILLAVTLGSKIIVNMINKCYLPTMLLFTGLIISDVPKIVKETKLGKKEIIISVLIIAISILLKSNMKQNDIIIKYDAITFFKLILIGIIDAATSIIPGISGTAILISLGYYNIIISTIANIYIIKKETLFIAIPFFIGFVIGIIILSKIINLMIKKYKSIMNILIITIIFITNINLLTEVFTGEFHINETVIGLILFVIPIYIRIKKTKKNIIK